MRLPPKVEELEPRRLLSWTISGNVIDLVPQPLTLMYPPPVYDPRPAPGAVIFADLNGNGIRDSGEPTTTTDASGNYVLTGSGSGGLLRIFELPPSGDPYPTDWPQGKPVAITDGQTLGPVFFINGNALIASGTIFEDLNGDGIRGPDEPGLSGWTATSGPLTAQSDASGGYSLQFSDPGGADAVELQAKPGWVITTPLGGYYPLTTYPAHGLDFGVKPIAPPGTPAPDLSGSLTATIPSTAYVGQSISGTLTINNQGNALARGSIQATIYASAGRGTLQIGDTPIGTFTASLNLAPGDSTDVPFTVTIPTSLSGSTHYVTARINSSHSLLESTEENNVAGIDTPLVVATEAADLALTIDGPAPLTAAPGESFTLPVTLSNPGGTTFSGPATVDLYASTDATLDSSDTLLSAMPLNSVHLAPAASRAVTLQFTAPASLSGFYFLIASAKSSAEPASADKSNNTAVSTTGVLFGSATGATPPPSVGSGQQSGDLALGPLDATFKLATSGPPRTVTDLMPTNPTGGTIRRRVRVTLYAVPTDGGSAVPVRTLTRQLHLRAGRSKRLKLAFRFSRRLPAGTYTLRADLQDLVGESLGPVIATADESQTFTITSGQ